jgi:hypothetical protein
MTCHRSLPGLAGKRLKAISLSNSDSAHRGNLLLFPTGQHPEAGMPECGDDAGYCSNALSAQHDREASVGDRTAHRKRVLGIVVLCSTLLLISGVVAIMIGWNTNLTRLSTLSVQPTAGSSRTN